MHAQSHSNQRSKPPLSARSPLRCCHHRYGRDPSSDLFYIIPILTRCGRGFACIASRPSSIFLGVKLVAHQGDYRRRGPHGRSCNTHAGIFFFLKDRDVQRFTFVSHVTVRSAPPHRRALPPSACGISPAARHNCLNLPAIDVLPHPRQWMHADVHAAILEGCPLMEPRDLQQPDRATSATSH